MKNNQEPVSGFDELIFENRNKEYGAYSLRKSYNRVVIISLIAASLTGIAVVGVPFLNVLGKQHNMGSGVNMRYVQISMDRIQPPVDESLIKPPSAPPPPNAPASIRYVAPVVVDTVLPIEKPMLQMADVRVTNTDTSQVVAVNSREQNEIIGEPGGDAVSDFFLLETKPTFRGGNEEKFREWVTKKVVYPKAAQDNGLQGKVYLTFIVERDGSVSNVKVIRGVDPLLDNEAVKAIEASPLWSPGKQRGNPVRVRFSIFVNFQNN
jgi:protein TonB